MRRAVAGARLAGVGVAACGVAEAEGGITVGAAVVAAVADGTTVATTGAAGVGDPTAAAGARPAVGEGETLALG